LPIGNGLSDRVQFLRTNDWHLKDHAAIAGSIL
jgi:hypothetical protein